MTAHSRSIDYPPPMATQMPLRRRVDEPAPIPAGDAHDRKYFLITIAALIAIYSLLQNGYWVPSGDSEVYISIARNIARGDGYTFNGQPVQMVPPGWPLVMAGVMKLTGGYFLPLKLTAMSCMIAFLGVAFWIVRRFVSPKQAMGIILLTGIISHVYQGTYWLISESLFCFVSTLALLLALQIREGKQQWWRIALMVILCGAAVTVRWAGVLGFLLVAAALVDGDLKPKLNRQWIAVIFAGVFTAGTFLVLRQAMKVTPDEAAAAKEYGGDAEDTGVPTVANADSQVAGHYSMITGTENSNGYVDRVVGWGRWFAFLFWQPFRAAAGSKALSLICNGVGWIVIVLLILTAVFTRRLLWTALLAYCAALAVNWPQANARYLVPVSFLLVLSVLLGAQHLRIRLPAWRMPLKIAVYVFVIGLLLCNGSLYAIEVGVARSSDFYATYEAGLNQNLIAAAKYLNTLKLTDGQIAVSGKYTNLNRTRSSPFGLRATTLLTGHEVVSVPWKLCLAPQDASGKERRPLFRYLRNNNIKYYLYQPPVTPWRIWHFRAGWWEKRRTGVTSDHDESGWQLYRVDLDDEKLARVDIPPMHGWPTQVPGLGAR